ncbi:unnamed protein product [Nezara viridula]|uniref:Uncharacterized protein n=1 Tax=Nezara viridula TaxID=85310 RepID=A0A9P0MQ96_NEZVI|nr:unnamed protein product [Nezara viridula]
MRFTGCWTQTRPDWVSFIL